MEENFSIMFDRAPRQFIEALVRELRDVIQCDWAAANWTWDKADRTQACGGNLFVAIESGDFIAVFVRCRLLRNGDVVSGSMYIEMDEPSAFFVAITPYGQLADESRAWQWIDSLRINSSRVDPALRQGVQFRIGFEISRPY